MRKLILSRRHFLTASAAGASSLVLAGCDQFDFLGARDNQVRDMLERANSLTYQAQRLLAAEQSLARTYSDSEIRQPQRANGSTDPKSPEYLALKNSGFAGYTLNIRGLVETELTFTLDQLRNRKEHLTGRCKDCQFLDICGGGFRVRALHTTGDLWAPDPACYLSDREAGLLQQAA